MLSEFHIKIKCSVLFFMMMVTLPLKKSLKKNKPVTQQFEHWFYFSHIPPCTLKPLQNKTKGSVLPPITYQTWRDLHYFLNTWNIQWQKLIYMREIQKITMRYTRSSVTIIRFIFNLFCYFWKLKYENLLDFVTCDLLYRFGTVNLDTVNSKLSLNLKFLEVLFATLLLLHV